MKQYVILIALSLSLAMFGQTTNDASKGIITYISAQNIYVQFVNTDGISIGDTLFSMKNDNYQSALIVKEMSTISCLCVTSKDYIPAVRNQVFAKLSVIVPAEVLIQNSKEAVSVNDQVIVASKANTVNNKIKSSVDGRVSLSTYLNNTSDTTVNSIYRLNLSLDARHIANSRFSAECYLSLTKKNTYTPYTSPTDSVKLINYQMDQALDLKIYNLAVKYEIKDSLFVILGRKINPNLANIGAVDGIQFEQIGKSISYGAVIGSRPDNYSYSYNPYLLQYGAYLGYQTKKNTQISQTSVAFFNQMNNMITDRSFLYVQHSNSLLQNVNLFGSAEIDLYGIQNNKPTTTFNFTSIYGMLQWQAVNNLSMSISYDARKNLYYYETYKNYIDSVLDKETRSGLRFQLNYRPFKFLSWGGNAGCRFATATSNTSYNGYSYLTFTQLPLDFIFRFDVTAIKANYLSGMIYGGSLSRDFFDGKLYTELSYRYVDYSSITTAKIPESIAEINLSWQFSKKLILSANFEAAFNPDNNLQGRAFINLSQRF